MRNYKNDFSSNAYNGKGDLEIISGVKFTPREIDVIACLLGGRTTKTICQFLSIEEKTVETHKYNIMRKLDTNSKEGIINFIEKSDKFSSIKAHYLDLLIQSSFKKYLQKIFNLIAKKELICLLVYKKKENNIILVNQLKDHLNLAGINVLPELKENHISRDHLSHYIDVPEIDFIIYLTPRSLIEKLNSGTSQTSLEIMDLTKKTGGQGKRNVLFLLENEGPLLDIPQEIRDAKYIDFGAQENYYFTVFEILKALLLDNDLEEISSDFKKQYETISSSQKSPSQLWLKPNDLSKEHNSERLLLSGFSRKSQRGLIAGGVVGLGVGVLLLFNINKQHTISSLNKVQNLQITRSDLPLPTDNVFLNRPELLKKIEAKLNGKQGIQTVALVGIGGAGKTTIARQYARQQKSSIVWEIDAKTKAGILDSFENQTYSFVNTEEDRKTLNEIQQTKDKTKKEEKIIHLVKKYLRDNPNWFLIFDNVEEFSAIQKYFPNDSATWGKGKVIITTRDSNIQNNIYINNVIEIGELTSTQKLSLFTKTMDHGNIHPLIPAQAGELEIFLKKLPPFPLDIIVAASYIRSMNISFDKYLELLSKEPPNLVNFDQELLESIGSYNQTRNSIITFSIENIIDKNQECKKLMYFISLVDNNRIPTSILEIMTNKDTVNSFMYYLKKYSLVNNTETIDFLSVFSIHDVTHDVIRELIKNTYQTNDKRVLLKLFSSLVIDKLHGAAYNEGNLLQTKLLLNHCVKFLNNSELLPEELRQDIMVEIGRAYCELRDYNKGKNFLDESLLIYQKRKKKSTESRGGDIRLLSFIGDSYGIAMRRGNFERNVSKLQSLAHLLEEEIKRGQQKISRTFLADGYLALGSIYSCIIWIQNEDKIWETIVKICKEPDAENKVAAFDPYFFDPELKKAYEKAYDFHQQVVNIRLAEGNPNHWQVGLAYHACAATASIGNLKSLPRIKEMGEKGREIFQALYAHDHARMGWSSGVIANLYSRHGLHKEAIPLYKHAITVHKKNTHNPDNSHILFLENKLSYSLILLGNFDEAEKILTENLNKPALGENINIHKTIHLLLFLYDKMMRKNKNIEKIKILRSKYMELLRKRIKS